MFLLACLQLGLGVESGVVYRPAHLRGLGSTVTDLINQYAAQFSVPPSIALAVAQKESGFNQAAVGAAGEVGVFQLMPATAAGLGVNPADLTQNVSGGVSLLSSLYRQFGNWSDALAAYNAGPTHLAAGRGYASSVLASVGAVSPLAPAGDSGPAVDLTGSDLFDSSTLDMSMSTSGADDPLLWAGLALAGVGLLWWATA